MKLLKIRRKPLSASKDWLKVGNKYFKREHFHAACGCYNEAIALDPKCADAYNGLELAKGKLGQDKEALEARNQAIKLNHEKAEYWNKRGLDDPKDGIKWFTKAIKLKLDPENAAYYCNRGNAKYVLKKYGKAIEDFKQALETDHGFAAAHNGLGLAHEVRRMYQEAIENYKQACYYDPENAAAYNENRVRAEDKLGAVPRGA